MALKVFVPYQEDAADDQAIRRQLREIQTLRDCTSAYVVRFVGALLFQGHVAVIIELMPKGSLWRALRHGEIEPWGPRCESARSGQHPCRIGGISAVAARVSDIIGAA